jgi:hypothetical protein
MCLTLIYLDMRLLLLAIVLAFRGHLAHGVYRYISVQGSSNAGAYNDGDAESSDDGNDTVLLEGPLQMR